MTTSQLLVVSCQLHVVTDRVSFTMNCQVQCGNHMQLTTDNGQSLYKCKTPGCLPGVLLVSLQRVPQLLPADFHNSTLPFRCDRDRFDSSFIAGEFAGPLGASSRRFQPQRIARGPRLGQEELVAVAMEHQSRVVPGLSFN